MKSCDRSGEARDATGWDATGWDATGWDATVARHIFQACPVWIYTQSNITQAFYSIVSIELNQISSPIYGINSKSSTCPLSSTALIVIPSNSFSKSDHLGQLPKVVVNHVHDFVQAEIEQNNKNLQFVLAKENQLTNDEVAITNCLWTAIFFLRCFTTIIA